MRLIGDVGRLLQVVAVAVDPDEARVVTGRLVELKGRLHLTRGLQVLSPPPPQRPGEEAYGGVRWWRMLRERSHIT